LNDNLSWTAGAGATTHNVYFGTDATPDAGESQGNQAGVTFDPGAMATSTTYYWRIDEVNAGGTTTGNIWSFTTIPAAPAQATNPSPATTATDIGINDNLSWTAGAGAATHDVYFGTDATPDAGESKGNQAGVAYDPGAMATSTTYYWRIDEVNAGGTTTGVVWSFTTAPPAPNQATNPSPATTATDIGLNDNLSWTAGAGATTHDVYFGTDATPDAGELIGNQAGVTYDPGAMATSTTYYWRIDEVNAGGTTTGVVWSFTTVPAAPAQATNPSPATTATDIGLNDNLSWTAGAGAATHNVYFGTDATPDAGESIGNQAGVTYDPGAMATSTTYYWRIDEVNAGGTTTGTVWSFTTVPAAPAQATNPGPADAAVNQAITADLSWTAGAGAATHNVYFGTDATPDAGESKGNQAGVTYDPGVLANDTTYYWRIDEVNAGGTTTGNVWSFTTIVPLPGQATTPSPANAAANVGVTSDLGWAVGADAASHDVYFGTDATPDAGESKGNQAGVTYDPGVLANDTTYYWRIDEVNAAGTTTGTIWSFTTIVAAPGQASNPGPADAAVNQAITVDLSWTAGSDAASHNVYFGTASPGDAQGNQVGTTFDPGVLANDTTYYWRIDEVNVAGVTTGAVWSFTTIVPLASPATNPDPANAAADVTVDSDLSWTAGSYAVTHDVYFGTDATPDAGELQGNQAGTTFDPGTMTHDTTYYWRIDEVNVAGTTTGTVWNFIAVVAVPDQATNPSPANTAANIDINNNLSWTAGAGATAHDVYFGTDATPDAGEFQGNQAGVAFDPGTLTNNTTYYWRIDETNAGGTTTGTLWSFTTIIAAPAQASGPDPSDGAIDVSLTTDLSWAASARASSYDVYFGTDSSLGAGQLQANQTERTFDPGTLDTSTTYYWRIDGININGTTTGDTWSFTTVPPPSEQASNPDPANGAVNVDINVDIAWTAGLGAISHDIYFGTSDSPEYQGNQSGSDFDPGTLSNDTTYYWRIDEINPGGTTAGQLWSFTTIVALPEAASGPTPANGTTAISLNTNLNWSAGLRAESHDVYFGTDPTPDSGELQANQTATAFDISGVLASGTTYYWRIDEVNVAGTTTGDIWSFTTIADFPSQATNPSPADTATNIDVSVDLSWTAGADTASHNVYLGTNPSLGIGNFMGNQTSAAFDAGTLQAHTTYYWRIDEVNDIGTTTGAVWSFTTINDLPGQASGPSPADGTSYISTSIDLTWLAGADALSHNVYFGTTGTPDYQGNQTGTYFDPGMLDTQTTYYWRIDEVNENGTTTGQLWSFTTADFISPLGLSGNPSPVDGAADVPVNAVLNWTAGTGAVYSSVYFGTDSTPDLQATQVNTTFAPGKLDGGTTYYWRIDQIDQTGTITMTGDLWSFTTTLNPADVPGQAQNLGPADESENININTSLWWVPGENATSHEVYFGTSPSPEYSGTEFGARFDPGTLDTDTTYYWRVDEVNEHGTTMGNVWSFTTIPDAPEKASQPSPADDAENVSVHTEMSWTAGDGAEWHDVYFGSVTPPVYRQSIYETSFSAGTLLDNTTYYWRIDEVNDGGITEGDIWSFTTTTYQASRPGRASGPSPSHSATNVSRTAQLNWNAGFGAVTHKIYFGTSSSPVFRTSQSGTSFDPGELEYATTYYWRIDEVNNVGTTTGYTWNFTTISDIPEIASGPSPPDGATNVDINVILGWPADGSATSYNVYFGTSQTPDYRGNQTASIFGPGTLQPGTTYYWRIDQVNAAGTTQGNVWQFTTAYAVIGQADHPTPINGADYVSTNTDLSWTAGFGAESHDLYFGTTNPPAYQGNQETTCYDLGTLLPDTLYYWRVDEVGLAGTTEGNLWSFTTTNFYSPPAQATEPYPADGATGTDIYLPLSWTAGSGTVAYDVYFGSSVETLLLQGQQQSDVFDPGLLTGSTTYYWRIDPVNSSGTTTGQIWSFTTAAIFPTNVTRCSISAGNNRTAPADTFRINGSSFEATEGDLLNSTILYLEIFNLNDNEPIYSREIEYNPGKLKKGRIGIRNTDASTGQMILVNLDLVRNTFYVMGRNVDLSGLQSPVIVRLEAGDYYHFGVAGEEISDYTAMGIDLPDNMDADTINGRKPISAKLLLGVSNCLRLGRSKFTSNQSGDSLTISGDIAVQDTSVDLTATDVVISWANYQETIPAGLITRQGTANTFSYKAPKGTNSGVQSTRFDFEKCTFSLTLKNTAVQTGDLPAAFGVAFGSFNETVTVSQ